MVIFFLFSNKFCNSIGQLTHIYIDVLRHQAHIKKKEPARLISHIFIALHLSLSLSCFYFYSLAFSVTLFCSEAVIAIIILLVRRNKTIGSGGELGGSFMSKAISGSLLFSLWIIYLVMSSLEAYGVITGF